MRIALSSVVVEGPQRAPDSCAEVLGLVSAGRDQGELSKAGPTTIAVFEDDCGHPIQIQQG